jgi:hypothetical protein
MKKTLLILFPIALLATACNKHNSDSGCMYKLTIKGNALGCEVGYDQYDPTTIHVIVDGQTYTQVDTAVDGSFSMVINRCSKDKVPVKIYAIDRVSGDSSTQSQPYADSSTFMADTGTLVIHFLEACKEDQWINASNFVGVVSKPDNLSYSPTGFSGFNPYDPFMAIYFSLATPMTGTGNYAVSSFEASVSSSPVYMAGTLGGTPPAGTVTVTSFGPVGGYVIGTFSVPAHPGYGVTDPAAIWTITGSFQLIRTQ